MEAAHFAPALALTLALIESSHRRDSRYFDYHYSQGPLRGPFSFSETG